MPHTWIIGAGKFGKRAARMLAASHGAGHITIVDPDPEAIKAVECNSINQDGISFLSTFGKEQGEDWVIPALPLHLAFEWLKMRWRYRFRFEKIEPPDLLLSGLPNVFCDDAGRLYASVADFLCPEDCPEPKAYCYYSGRKRKYDLFDFIKKLGDENFFSIVIRSHQRAKGVGGFKVNALLEAEKKIIYDNENQPVLLATACRCHSVIDIFNKCIIKRQALKKLDKAMGFA